MTGLPQWADISCDEMLEALIEPAMQIIRTVQEMLENPAGADGGCVFRWNHPDRGSAQLFALIS